VSKFRKSLVLTFGQNYYSFVLQFIASIIIARLLTPAEIGVFSVAMVLIGLAHRLRDFGAASYVIQEKELTPDKIRAAFSMTLITAWFMAMVIWLGSGYAAEFYREPGIKTVMMIVSLNFVLIPFGTMPMAYMQRNMDFEHVALINVATVTVASTTSVGLAYMGFSYFSLAWGAVAGVLCSMILAQVWRPKDFPMLPGFREIRKVVSFGSLSSLTMILNDVSQSAAELILGRMSGMVAVGYFGRAMGLVSMFDRFIMNALWSVALPHFAEQARKEGGIKDKFLNSITYSTALSWPFFISLGFLAQPIILVMYGPQWGSSVPLLQLICISAVITAPFLLMSSMLTAIGQMKQNLYALIIRVPVRAIMLVLSVPFGLEVVVATFIVSSLIDVVVYVLQCRLILLINMKEIAQALYKSSGVAVVTSIVPLLVSVFGKSMLVEHMGVQLLLELTGCLLGWLVGLFLFKHPLRLEISNLFKMAKPYFSAKK